MDLDDFMTELDLINPQWFFDQCTKSELISCVKLQGLSFDNTIKVDQLRRLVANRLYVCARATHSYILKHEKDLFELLTLAHRQY